MDTFSPSGKIHGPIIHEPVLKLTITAGAKLLYAVLCSSARDKDHCWLCLGTMASKLACSISSVKRYLKELREAQLISVSHRHGHSSLFTLLPPPAEMVGNDNHEQESHEPLASEVPSHLVQEQPNLSFTKPNMAHQQANVGCIKNLNNLQEDSPQYSPLRQNESFVGAAISLPDFEKVYARYPRKEAKGLARMAWLRLAKNGDLPQTSVILASIERFIGSHDWQRENGRFIPHLSNFLKGERWNDAPSGEAVPQPAPTKESEQLRLAQEQATEQRQLEHEKKKARYMPEFEAFAARFTGAFHFPMVFGRWLALREQNRAPQASDVPEDTTLGIMEFMARFQRGYRSAHLPSAKASAGSRSSHDGSGPTSLSEILRQTRVFTAPLPDESLSARPVAC